MTKLEAEQIAETFSGRSWRAGDGVWLVIVKQPDGKVLVVSDDLLCEYETQKHFEQALPSQTIPLKQYSALLN